MDKLLNIYVKTDSYNNYFFVSKKKKILFRIFRLLIYKYKDYLSMNTNRDFTSTDSSKDCNKSNMMKIEIDMRFVFIIIYKVVSLICLFMYLIIFSLLKMLTNC